MLRLAADAADAAAHDGVVVVDGRRLSLVGAAREVLLLPAAQPPPAPGSVREKSRARASDNVQESTHV